ncbi:MAG TPA: hypothetical protein VHG71_11380 [Verrucomicrobiae bacterium]|nr:hypothetical protein [Verrucomicrobiae bacterium]
MKNNFLKINLTLLAALVLPQIGGAQFFTYANGDLVAGFRKASGGSYELVVNVGNITNFLAQPIGTVIPIANLSSNQLGDSFGNINTSQFQWSVSAGLFGSIGTWNGFPLSTIWFTLPRSNPSTQTTPPLRDNNSAQQNCKQSILGFESGASLISSQLGTINSDNNANVVREPVNYNNEGENYSVFVQDSSNPSIADYNGNLGYNIENLTPRPFSTPSVSDLYQSVSTMFTNSGPADYIGYFTLNTNGVMTFTRAVQTATPPTPQIISVARANNTTTIFFTTTNNFTYTLYYTNSAGLSVPVANWPTAPTTITGNGLTNSLSDTTTDAIRFYRISVH